MSGFLLDTNVPSELIRSRPNPRAGLGKQRRPPFVRSAAFLVITSPARLLFSPFP